MFFLNFVVTFHCLYLEYAVCYDFTFIPKEKECDTKEDCKEGEDEQFCGKVV